MLQVDSVADLKTRRYGSGPVACRGPDAPVAGGSLVKEGEERCARKLGEGGGRATRRSGMGGTQRAKGLQSLPPSHETHGCEGCGAHEEHLGAPGSNGPMVVRVCRPTRLLLPSGDEMVAHEPVVHYHLRPRGRHQITWPFPTSMGNEGEEPKEG